jgi:hypothetical protein
LSAELTPPQIVGRALLKLDVQGYEYEALHGCETLLGRFDAVVVECSFVELYEGQRLFADVAAWLERRGFGLSGQSRAVRDRTGAAIQADFFFRRRDRLRQAA